MLYEFLGGNLVDGLPPTLNHQPGFFQSSQATVLELWPSPDLEGLPGTQLDISWSHLGTTQKHRKRPDLTGTCLEQKVVLVLFQSSQATVLELWASPDLQGPPGTQLETFRSHLDTPPKHRKRPDLTGKCLNQKVVMQASSRALRPPFWSSGLPLTS